MNFSNKFYRIVANRIKEQKEWSRSRLVEHLPDSSLVKVCCIGFTLIQYNTQVGFKCARSTSEHFRLIEVKTLTAANVCGHP